MKVATKEYDEFEWQATFTAFVHSEIAFSFSTLHCDQHGHIKFLRGCPTLLHSPVKDAIFSASASLQTTKAIMNRALRAQTWHVINAKKHSIERTGASCCNLLLFVVLLVYTDRYFDSFYSQKLWADPLRRDGKHMNSKMRKGREKERELHLVLNVWLSGLGWVRRSIGCDWYNFSHLKSSCGDCCHVSTLEWNNVPRGPVLHPNAFVTLWACMRHLSLDTCTVPCGLLSHIGMLHSHGHTEPQIEKAEKQPVGDVDWDKGCGGEKAGSWFLWGSVFASGLESW